MIQRHRGSQRDDVTAPICRTGLHGDLIGRNNTSHERRGCSDGRGAASPPIHVVSRIAVDNFNTRAASGNDRGRRPEDDVCTADVGEV